MIKVNSLEEFARVGGKNSLGIFYDGSYFSSGSNLLSASHFFHCKFRPYFSNGFRTIRIFLYEEKPFLIIDEHNLHGVTKIAVLDDKVFIDRYLGNIEDKDRILKKLLIKYKDIAHQVTDEMVNPDYVDTKPFLRALVFSLRKVTGWPELQVIGKSLRESLDPPKYLSEVEFDNLPAPNAQNINARYKVGRVAFDNKDGFGSTPNNREVHYFGFVATMTPSVFLRFAAAGDREEQAVKFEQFIKNRAPMGAPMLEITANLEKFKEGEPLRVDVVGHEGRARMTAIQKVNGSMDKIPVHFILKSGYRSRHLSPEFFQALRDVGMSPEKIPDFPLDAHLGKIFWDGKTL